jgi:hypothetical protein
MNEVRGRHQGGNDLGEAIGNDRYQRGYHGTFEVAIDTITLAPGWQGFEQEDFREGFD